MSEPKCFPVFTNELAVKIKSLKHPLFDPLTFKPFDVELEKKKAPFMILTGPNMGGKSTFLKTVCISIILSQIGYPVQAESMETCFFSELITRIGCNDDIIKGQSTFYKELSDLKKCFNQKGYLFVALDEIGRGTSTKDGYSLARGIIEYLKRSENLIGIVTTHYRELASEVSSDLFTPKVMGYSINENNTLNLYIPN